MSSKKLHRWYMQVLSGYNQALVSGQIGKNDLVVREQGKIKRIDVPIRSPQHIGMYMAIDEKTINGSCYTILSNRDSGKIALMANTLKTKYLHRIIKGCANLMKVKSLSRDMAQNYDWLGRMLFMNAYHVIDKFHVIKHALDSLQAIRIRYRQEELAKKRKVQQVSPSKKIHSPVLANGDTISQLLARSRGLLFKNKHNWSSQQKARATLLFAHYPEIEKAYRLVSKLRKWYTPTKHKTTYRKTRNRKKNQLQQWIKMLNKSAIYEMKNLSYTIQRHEGQILHYFFAKETNAKAEALNRNIQRFININYGTRNNSFFFFRLKNYFA